MASPLGGYISRLGPVLQSGWRRGTVRSVCWRRLIALINDTTEMVGVLNTATMVVTLKDMADVEELDLMWAEFLAMVHHGRIDGCPLVRAHSSAPKLR